MWLAWYVLCVTVLAKVKVPAPGFGIMIHIWPQSPLKTSSLMSHVWNVHHGQHFFRSPVLILFLCPYYFLYDLLCFHLAHQNSIPFPRLMLAPWAIRSLLWSQQLKGFLFLKEKFWYIIICECNLSPLWHYKHLENRDNLIYLHIPPHIA